MEEKIRFGIIGFGQRGVGAYGKLLTSRFAEDTQLVAVADVNSKRLSGGIGLLGLEDVKSFTDYHRFLDCDLDAIVVTTPDYTHEEVAVDALKTGRDVICEKPLATTAAGLRNIIDAKSPGQVLQIGFVLRYNRVYTTAKKLIADGAVGEVKQIVATDNRRGADYFRRWHRFAAKSGGLFNHKSTHLLDVVNWLVDSVPVKVAASGGVSVFVPGKWQGERCLTCDSKKECPEYLDLRREPYESLYLKAEDVDGYIRDTCVFTSEKDTFDHAAAVIDYDSGVTASYNLCLFAPLDTRQIMVFGDGGKLELDEKSRRIVVRPRGSEDVMEYRVDTDTGGHGGGDSGLLDEFISCVRHREQPMADAKAGALSCLLSLAAERSARERRPVTIDEMVRESGGSFPF